MNETFETRAYSIILTEEFVSFGSFEGGGLGHPMSSGIRCQAYQSGVCPQCNMLRSALPHSKKTIEPVNWQWPRKASSILLFYTKPKLFKECWSTRQAGRLLLWTTSWHVFGKSRGEGLNFISVFRLTTIRRDTVFLHRNLQAISHGSAEDNDWMRMSSRWCCFVVVLCCWADSLYHGIYHIWQTRNSIYQIDHHTLRLTHHLPLQSSCHA